MIRDDFSDDQSHQPAEPTYAACCSPQREGPLLVAAQPATVDGGRAGHSVQVVGAVGQRWDPLTVPLGLLFPGEQIQHTHTRSEAKMLSTSKLLCTFLQRPSAK